MHRLTLGDFELTILSDGNYFLDGGAFFGVIPKVMWSKRMHPDELNRLSCGLNSVLVRGGKKTVLIETGVGNKLGERMKKIYCPGREAVEQLARRGCRSRRHRCSRQHASALRSLRMEHRLP